MSELDPIADQRGDPDGIHILAKLTQLPIDRIEYYANSDTSIIADIQCGVLFLMAFWSGPSVNAFRELTRIVMQHDPDGELQFVTIDVDGAQQFSAHPLFAGKLGGWGETAWVNDGQIQSTSGLGFNPSCFEPNTKALLETRRKHGSVRMKT